MSAIEITKNPRQAWGDLSADARAVLEANRDWLRRYYPSLEGRRMTAGPCFGDANREHAALEELVTKGFAQRVFYRYCYGHTDYCLT